MAFDKKAYNREYYQRRKRERLSIIESSRKPLFDEKRAAKTIQNKKEPGAPAQKKPTPNPTKSIDIIHQPKNAGPSLNRADAKTISSYEDTTKNSTINSTIKFGNFNVYKDSISTQGPTKSVASPPGSWPTFGKIVFLLSCLAVVVATSSIIILENSKILEKQGHHWPVIFSVVLEVAIVLLIAYKHPVHFSFANPIRFLKFLRSAGFALGVKIAAIFLVFFSFKLATINSEIEGRTKISEVSYFSDISDIKRQIEVEQKALETYTKSRAIGAMRKTQITLQTLRKKLENAKESETISGLKDAHRNEIKLASLGRGLPLIINLIFSHLIGTFFVTFRVGLG